MNTIGKIKDNREKTRGKTTWTSERLENIWKGRREEYIYVYRMCHLYDMIEGKKRKEISNKDESHYKVNESILPFLHRTYF